MKEFELMLAPMENVFDAAFREECFKAGADSTFTEMARIAALARGNKSTLSKIQILNGVPTYIQLIGSNETELDRFLKGFKEVEGFLGFNLNLGCPSPEMINKGMGCALIKRVSKVQKIVDVIKKQGYSASVKLRLGMNRFEKEKKIYLKLIENVDADFFVVHAKHGQENSSDPSDFSVYPGCVATGKKIIANGDIKTKEQVEYLKSIGVKGAMIGRAAIGNAGIFRSLRINSP